MFERIAEPPRAVVFDFAAVPFVECSGIHALELLGRKLARNGGRRMLTGLSPRLLMRFEAHGLGPPAVCHERNPAEAVARITGAAG